MDATELPDVKKWYWGLVCTTSVSLPRCAKPRVYKIIQFKSISILAIIRHPHLLMFSSHVSSSVLQNKTITVDFSVM